MKNLLFKRNDSSIKILNTFFQEVTNPILLK